MPRPKRRSSDRQPPVARLVVVMMVSGALLVGAVLGSGIWLAIRTGSNCEGIHRIVAVGAKIIDGRERLANQLELGLITRDEYEQRLEQTTRALEIWRSADCR